ncbi:class I SAM-dependent methyltransferase [Roseateles terrae]|uniref:Methyltransferase domain-containing protein n=1 Tax=Roseateles terrae TaxID=431060 RepID=A0ABR6GY84_9BURK|nr:SAM-dependent methyltransferase [Roseateles terrae]MBB3197058.1 hypothetical protein [Roseateles terrae]
MFSFLVPPSDSRPAPDERERFMRLLQTAVVERRLERLLLSKYEGDQDIERLTVRLIELRGAPTLSFLWRHATKDITRNLAVDEGLAEIQQLMGSVFAQANLDTTTQQVQLRFSRKGKPLLHVARKPGAAQAAAPASALTPASAMTPASAPAPTAAAVPAPSAVGTAATSAGLASGVASSTGAPAAKAPSERQSAVGAMGATVAPAATAVPAANGAPTAPAGAADEGAPSLPSRHDREKPRALSLASPFWRELGVTHEVKGRVDLVPAMARKWKQINKFIEIFGSAIRHAGLSEPGTRVRLADFGSGKGYLTFAMHDYLHSQGLAPDVQGVELRPDMVRVGNDAVARHGLQGLRFEQGDVRERDDMRLEVMVALHACDIATDYAMHVGLRSEARIIMCAPCCHKEVRPQMRTPAALRPLLQHGIHLGQEAEMVTDSVRALLLELMGYDTQVIEFIALEHTSKNKMVLAVKRPQGLSPARRAELVEQLQAIKQFYGLRQQTLETLLVQDGHLHAA